MLRSRPMTVMWPVMTPRIRSTVRTWTSTARTRKRYRSYLRKRQDTVAARIGSTPDERYEVGLNAFTAEITGEQAATLARTDGVVSVHRDRLRRVPDDKKSVDFLGLSGHDGVWSKLGGPGTPVVAWSSVCWTPASGPRARPSLEIPSGPRRGRHPWRVAVRADPLGRHHHDAQVRRRPPSPAPARPVTTSPSTTAAPRSSEPATSVTPG